jgi:N-dimethylarginine dimethylaminohydrolase
MFAPLRRVLLKRPDEAFAVDEPRLWHYTDKPDLEAAQAEHDALAAHLRNAGAEVLYHDEPQENRADAVYLFDPALITDEGAIILRMGKALRQGEEAAMEQKLEALGVPILSRLQPDALAEGGDLLWVDHDTLAVGQGFRTNVEGLMQLAEALRPIGVSVIPVELPYHKGPEACLHLLSLISIVDERLAVVYPPLLSTPFWQLLLDLGFRLLEVPEAEFVTMGTNVLATAPGQCIMLEGNPITRQLLESAGCRVKTYRGYEISLKAEGGPTCLTRPLLRR